MVLILLTGIMKPTDGKISVMGNDPFRERIRNAGNIGVVFGQKTQLWWDIPVKDSFELLHSIYEICATVRFLLDLKCRQPTVLSVEI